MNCNFHFISPNPAPLKKTHPYGINQFFSSHYTQPLLYIRYTKSSTPTEFTIPKVSRLLTTVYTQQQRPNLKWNKSSVARASDVRFFPLFARAAHAPLSVHFKRKKFNLSLILTDPIVLSTRGFRSSSFFLQCPEEGEKILFIPRAPSSIHLHG